jgi:hypothetical protein
MKHEKNFEGVEAYLPGLVSVTKRGRRGNHYVLNVPAIKALPQQAVKLKHTPPPGSPLAGEVPAVAALVPALPDNLPADADRDPAAEGANSTRDTKNNTNKDRTREASTSKEQEKESATLPLVLTDNRPPSAAAEDNAQASSLAEGAPVPGDGAPGVRKPSEGSGIPRVSGETQADQEGLREAHRAAQRRVGTITREVEKRIRSEKLRREVVARALLIDAGDFSGSIDALIDAAIDDGDPW